MFKPIFKQLKYTSLMLVLLFFNRNVKAQDFSYSVPSSHNIQLTPVLNNPGVRQEGLATLIGDFHSYLGAFSDVNYINILGLLNFNKKRAIGTQFLHESTSDFFTRTRFYGMYQEHISLNKKTTLSLGAKIGFINFKMEALGGIAGGAAWAPDLALGIVLNNEKYFAGASLEQVTNPSLQPIDYVFILDRVLELNIGYRFTLSPYVEYIPELRYRMNEYIGFARWNNAVTFYDKFGVTANYLHKLGFTVGAFYQNENNTTDGFQFFFSYFFPTGTLQYVDAAQIELGLVLQFQHR